MKTDGRRSVIEVSFKRLTTRITGCGGMIDHTKNRGYRIPVHAIVSTRVVFLPLCDFCSSIARRCADGVKFTEQDSVWQSRKRFDALGRGRFIARRVSTPIHSERPATVPIAIPSVCICVHQWFINRIARHRATRMRIGRGQTFNSETHDPPSSRDADECD